MADGLFIDLDKIPKKYDGLDGTELAISESQERMAVVLSPDDEQAFIQAADRENLEAVKVAHVTETPRLVMNWQGDKIVDISRSFLDTNGAKQQTAMAIPSPDAAESPFQRERQHNLDSTDTLLSLWKENLENLNVCSQKGLIEKFDSTVGTGSSMMPLGGKNQLTPMEGMVARIPVLEGETDTVTGMSAGYDPEIACWSPYHGGYYAVIDSICRLTAMGFDTANARLSLQEYFEKPGNDPVRWGKPLAALLGAFTAQKTFNAPAIGGKDSMSGTFKDLDVPPTLVSFAVAAGNENHLCSPEFKNAGRSVVWLKPHLQEDFTLNTEQLLMINRLVYHGIQAGTITAVKTVGIGGVASALSVMCFGNDIGVSMDDSNFNLTTHLQELFTPYYGSFVLEVKDHETALSFLNKVPGSLLGQTISTPCIKIAGASLELNELSQGWQYPLEKIFPTKTEASGPVKQAHIMHRPTKHLPKQSADPGSSYQSFPVPTARLILRGLLHGQVLCPNCWCSEISHLHPLKKVLMHYLQPSSNLKS